MKFRFFNKNDYKYWVDVYIQLSEKNNYPISQKVLKEFDLPNWRWYIDNCPDHSVKKWNDFKEWCGFVVPCKLTKETASKFIYRMQDGLDRPLIYDDFRGKGCYHISVTTINKLWGSLNKMKEDLGLEIIQESMIDRTPSKEEYIENILNIKKYITDQGRDFITLREISKHKEWYSETVLRKYSIRYFGKEIKDLLYDYGIQIGVEGCGISYTFDDGEKTTSQFEYLFSRFLRENNYVYNISYFRDIKYSSFIDSYEGNMNCDYVINIGNEMIYIEIAGILDNYKSWYYKNKEIISSKHKLAYQKKLYLKENMLKESGLKYFILFPCDLTIKNLNDIIKNPSIKLKREIEKFNHTNIDWQIVRSVGVLNYDINVNRTWNKRTNIVR